MCVCVWVSTKYQLLHNFNHHNTTTTTITSGPFRLNIWGVLLQQGSAWLAVLHCWDDEGLRSRRVGGVYSDVVDTNGCWNGEHFVVSLPSVRLRRWQGFSVHHKVHIAFDLYVICICLFVCSLLCESETIQYIYICGSNKQLQKIDWWSFIPISKEVAPISIWQ